MYNACFSDGGVALPFPRFDYAWKAKFILFFFVIILIFTVVTTVCIPTRTKSVVVPACWKSKIGSRSRRRRRSR